MEGNSIINRIIARLSNYELDIFLDMFEERSQPIYKNIPDYHLVKLPQNRTPCDYFPQQVNYFYSQEINHFYVDGEEVSKDEYECFERIKHIVYKAREIALEEARLQTLRDMGFISNSTEEKSAHTDPIPEDPNLISEVIQFLKDNKERMAHLDYIIENLKNGPKSSFELEKMFSDSRKAYGPLVYCLLDKLKDAGVVKMRSEPGSETIMCELTLHWEDMYSIMKK
jgi:hypothetical protein